MTNLVRLWKNRKKKKKKQLPAVTTPVINQTRKIPINLPIKEDIQNQKHTFLCIQFIIDKTFSFLNFSVLIGCFQGLHGSIQSHMLYRLIYAQADQ